MSDLSNIRLYTTPEHECSYLPEEEATTLFVDPEQEITEEIYSALSNSGFRRSGQHLYRPHCQHCQACIATRVPVNLFKPNRNQRRCLKRNHDLTMNVATLDVETHYPLYERYISLRHYDGDMYPPSLEQFQSFLNSGWGETLCLEFRLDSKLISVAVTDQLKNALSAVYTFFEPEEEKRSLGVFSILKQIEWAQSHNLPYLYLGYWIKHCQKMNYKLDYRPTEVMANGRWTRLL